MALKPCKTLEEFIVKYDKDLERILCKSFKNYINVDNLEEIKSEIYVHLLEKKFFDTYDASRAQFSTYLYTYLFKFLKARKTKADKEVVNGALSIDAPIYHDSNVTILDSKDFQADKMNVVDMFEVQDFEEKIKTSLEKRLKNLKIYNPYKPGSLEYIGWQILESPRSMEEIESFLERLIDVTNPYHAKKESVKYSIWETFSKATSEVITDENLLWSNVAGVKAHELNFSALNGKEFEIFNYVKSKKPSYIELLCGLEQPNSEIESSFCKLERIGFVEGFERPRKRYYVYRHHSESYYTFNSVKNVAWHLVYFFKEHHPELFEFDSGYYHLNTKSNVAFKMFKMMLNGKTNKLIATTYRVNNSILNQTKNTILKDIKRLMETRKS